MLIARWLLLFAGLAICVSIALYILTRNPLFWLAAKRLILVTAAGGLIFFGVLILERLAFL